VDAFEGSVEASLNSVTDGEIGGTANSMVHVPMGTNAALRVVAYTHSTAASSTPSPTRARRTT